MVSTIARPKALPQVTDFEMVDRAPDPPTATVPIGTLSENVPYNPSSAAEVASHTSAAAVPKSEKNPSNHQEGACASLPRGSGPIPSPDTADAFINYDAFASAASDADEPSGYFNTFTNIHASSSAYEYLGFTTLSAYDTDSCAAYCDTIEGCSAFNICKCLEPIEMSSLIGFLTLADFERDPTLEPGPGCSNPPSSTVIKCVFWGGPVVPDNTGNGGQYRDKFHVVIAGSNGFITNRLLPIDGYNAPDFLSTAAINAPRDCTGADTFLGSRVFNSGPFDPRLCSAACDSESEYNRANADTLDNPRPCQFFNTYLTYKNGVVQGQYCALYSESWDPSYATNMGQWRGSDYYTVDYSFAYSNSTDIGIPTGDCLVASPSTTSVQAPYSNTSSTK